MTLTGDQVLGLLGKEYGSKEVKTFLARHGETPVLYDDFWAICARHHFTIGFDDGVITEITFPDERDGEIGVLPFGLTPGGQAAVRAALGTPTASPPCDALMFEVPNDVYDLPEHTVWISFTADGEAISALTVRPASVCAEERAERAKAPKRGGGPKKKAKAPRKGAHLDALIAAMERGKKRRKPKAAVRAWLTEELAEDLRRFLEVHAAYDHGRIDVGDYKLDDDVTEDEVPGRDDVIVIGRTAGGDLWFVPRAPRGRATPVALALHEEEWAVQEGAASLDAHIAACAADADDGMLDIERPS